jgi:hypothetical protein
LTVGGGAVRFPIEAGGALKEIIGQRAVELVDHGQHQTVALHLEAAKDVPPKGICHVELVRQ